MVTTTRTTTTTRSAVDWSIRTRWLAGAILVAASLLWFVAEVISDLGKRAYGDDFTAVHPHAAGVGLSADLLAVPFMFGGVVVWYLLGRVASPRLAATGAVLSTCGAAGQGALIGVEIAGYIIQTQPAVGLQPAAFDSALDSASGVPVLVFFVLWYVGAFLGILVSMAAVWRSRTLPRGALAMTLAFAAASLLDVPGPLTGIALVASVWMAVALVRGGPRHAPSARGGEL